jgi:hypothetical protein
MRYKSASAKAVTKCSHEPRLKLKLSQQDLFGMGAELQPVHVSKYAKAKRPKATKDK